MAMIVLADGTILSSSGDMSDSQRYVFVFLFCDL